MLMRFGFGSVLNHSDLGIKVTTIDLVVILGMTKAVAKNEMH